MSAKLYPQYGFGWPPMVLCYTSKGTIVIVRKRAPWPDPLGHSRKRRVKKTRPTE